MVEDSGGVEYGPKYKEEDWRNSDLRGVRIYEEEWTGWMNTVEGEQTSVSMAKEGKREVRSEDSVMCGYGLRMVQDIRKRIGQRVIYGVSRYTKRNGLYG